MRSIPGKTKVKVELFKGVTVADILIGTGFLGVAFLFVTSSIPWKIWIAGGIALIGVFLLARIDSEPNYRLVLHIIRHFTYVRRYQKDGVVREEAAEKKSEREQEWEALSLKEQKKRKKQEKKILKSKGASEEEKEEIRSWQKERSENAVKQMAFAKDAATKRKNIKDIMPFTKIEGGFIHYGSDYLGAVIEIPPVEFRFFSSIRRKNSIEQGLGSILRSLNPDYAANIVKIERPVIYDTYIRKEQQKIEEARVSYEHGLMKEKELQARIEVIQARIAELKDLNEGSRVVVPFYYLVLFEADRRQMENQVNSALTSLRQGELAPKRLNDKELAVFLRYTNEIDFDEREIDKVVLEEYANWAMPRFVDVFPRQVIVNRVITHNFRIAKFPVLVGDAWLAGVFSMPSTKCVIKCRPMNRLKAIRNIDHSLTELRSQYRNTGVDSKRMELAEHIKTLSDLLGTLQGENETLLEVNVYITAYDLTLTRKKLELIQPPVSSRRRFNDMKKTIRRLYRENNLRLSNLDFDQVPAFIATQISARDSFSDDGLGMPSNTLAAAYPWIFASVADQGGIHMGSSDGTPVFIDFFRRDSERLNSNLVVVGKSGSGKSFSTKSLLCHLAADDSKIFILDPENEYSELARNLNGKFINVGNARQGRLNPFHVITALEDDESGQEQESSNLATHLQFLEEFFSQILPDCEKDALEYLNSLVERTYAKKGIDSYTDFSRLKPEDYPIFDDLYDMVLLEFQQSQNDYIRSMLRTIMNYIAKFSTGGRNSNIWNGPSTITTEENFTVFNFQSLLANRNMTIANAQMLLVLKYIDNEIIKNRDYNTKYGLNRKVIVVIDEAHVFIDVKYPAALDFMFQLAKRIRKYNGMQIVITQNIKDFVGSEEIVRKSTAIINACQYSMIFSLAPNDMDDLCKLYEKAGGINQQEQEQIISAQRGHAFMILGASSRTSFQVETPEVLQTLFTNPNYQSPYFTGEEGSAYWERWIASSKMHRQEKSEELPAVEDEAAVEDETASQTVPIWEEVSEEEHSEKFGSLVTLMEADKEEVPETVPIQETVSSEQEMPVHTSKSEYIPYFSHMEELFSDLLGRFSYDAIQSEVLHTVRQELELQIPKIADRLTNQSIAPTFAGQEESTPSESTLFKEEVPVPVEEDNKSLDEILAELNALKESKEEEDEFSEEEFLKEELPENGSILEENKVTETEFFEEKEEEPDISYSPILLMEDLDEEYIEVTLEELAQYNEYILKQL